MDVPMMRSLALFLCLSGAVAFVKDLNEDQLHTSLDHVTLDAATSMEWSSGLNGAPPPQAFMSLRGSDANVEGSKVAFLLQLPGHLKEHCVWMLMALCTICCCGGVLKALVGEQAAGHIGFFVTLVTFIYLLNSGIYSAYWKGEHVGFTCKVMCWWAIFMMVLWSCIACTFCCCAGLLLGIKNVMIQKMREEYNEKMKLISGPRAEYYESDAFRQKCDRYFDKADVDKSGSLDMEELQAILVEITGEPQIVQMAPLLQQTFEAHGDSVVEKHEFVEMMKFVSVVALKEGSVTLEQAYEIMQLPDTATKSEVSKAYKKLAMRYHPDKQAGGDPEKIKRDMAEINDAHTCLDNHFKAKAKEENVQD